MSARGDSCGAAARNIGKNFVSAIDAPLDSWWVEQQGGVRGEVEGQAGGHGGLAKVTSAHRAPEAGGEGVGESCGWHGRADMHLTNVSSA